LIIINNPEQRAEHRPVRLTSLGSTGPELINDL